MLTSLHHHLLLLQRFVLLANYVADDLRTMLASSNGVLNVAIDFYVALLLFYGVHFLLFHALKLTSDVSLHLLYVFVLPCGFPFLYSVKVVFFFLALLHLAVFILFLFLLVLQLLSVAFIVQLVLLPQALLVSFLSAFLSLLILS